MGFEGILDYGFSGILNQNLHRPDQYTLVNFERHIYHNLHSLTIRLPNAIRRFIPYLHHVTKDKPIPDHFSITVVAPARHWRSVTRPVPDKPW